MNERTYKTLRLMKIMMGGKDARGGLCTLYRDDLPLELRDYEDFDELLWNQFGIEIGAYCFAPKGDTVIFLEYDEMTSTDTDRASKIYTFFARDPYGDHPLGKARHRLINNLIKRIEND